MQTAWTYLERLARYPHRGVGTEEERKAALEAAGWLQSMGYAVEVQEFTAPRDTLYAGPGMIMVLFVAASILTLWLNQPWPSLLLCLAALFPLLGEMKGRGIDLDVYCRKVRSRNVIARPREPGGERLTIVISGHLDTQRATYLFHPNVTPYIPAYFNLAYGSLGLMLIALLLRGLLPAAPWTGWLVGLCAALVTVHALFLLLAPFSGGFINGANDNGTGAALTLALAEHCARNPLPGVRCEFVLTGAEEVGTRGMKAFMHAVGYDPATTFIINLDNLGGGGLHFLEGEGMLFYRRYGQQLVALARTMAAERLGAVKAKHNLLLPTDGMIPAAAGYEAISFLAFRDDGSLPNYHWYSDTLENVDRDLVTCAEEFLVEYIGRLAAQAR